MNLFTLIDIKWRSQKDLLNTTGKAREYTVITSEEKRTQKRTEECLSGTVSSSCTPETHRTTGMNSTPKHNSDEITAEKKKISVRPEDTQSPSGFLP